MSRSPAFPDWLKENKLLFILLLLALVQGGMLYWVDKRANKALSDYVVKEFLDNTNTKDWIGLDFQNMTGAGKIKSSFGDILVASMGSRRKGNGYELLLKVVNPLSVTLKNETAVFYYYENGNKREISVNDLNASILPGHTHTLTAFFSDLPDKQLSNILVEVGFDQMAAY